jgi:hypothetical protein
MNRPRPSFATTIGTLLMATALTVAGCGGGSAGGQSSAGLPSGVPASGVASGSAAPAARPSSPAMVKIVQPTNGETVTGSSVHVVLSLTGARIVPATTTNIRPDEGHVHLYVDNVLVSMNYALEEDLPVHAGTYVIKAEFVASDHAPFNPRVWSQQVFFTVNP